MRIVLTVEKGPHQGRSFAFDQHDNFIVGRAKWAHFRLPKKDKYFSRVHFLIEINPPHCRLMDLKSRNGTLVNGRAVKVADLQDGDVIEGGITSIRVSIEAAEASPAEAASDGSDRSGRGVSSTLQLPDAACLGDSPEPKSVTAVPSPARPSWSSLLPPDHERLIRSRPQPIPGYQIVNELGRGGMGVVYRAVCEADGAVVALKTIKPAVVPSQSDLRRFLREAEILRQLQHQNIVAFRDAGEAGGLLYFAMEYVPGTDAARYLREHPAPLPVHRAVGIVCQLLSGLQYAHERGFVHRDIKPSNLLLTKVEGRGVVKLADFGLARAYQESRMSGLTLMGDMAGTIAFMAPEQITHYRDVKPAADQYSAAATLYTLLTNRYIHNLPHEISEQLRMILQEDAVPIGARRDDLPATLAAVIHRALSREAEQRFLDVEDLREALLPFGSGSGGTRQ